MLVMKDCRPDLCGSLGQKLIDLKKHGRSDLELDLRQVCALEDKSTKLCEVYVGVDLVTILVTQGSIV